MSTVTRIYKGQEITFTKDDNLALSIICADSQLAEQLLDFAIQSYGRDNVLVQSNINEFGDKLIKVFKK